MPISPQEAKEIEKVKSKEFEDTLVENYIREIDQILGIGERSFPSYQISVAYPKKYEGICMILKHYSNVAARLMRTYENVGWNVDRSIDPEGRVILKFSEKYGW